MRAVLGWRSRPGMRLRWREASGELMCLACTFFSFSHSLLCLPSSYLEVIMTSNIFEDRGGGAAVPLCSANVFAYFILLSLP